MIPSGTTVGPNLLFEHAFESIEGLSPKYTYLRAQPKYLGVTGSCCSTFPHEHELECAALILADTSGVLNNPARIL